MDKNYKLFSDFLQFTLSDGQAAPASLKEMDWEALYRFAKEQAIVGVVFEGLKKLKRDDPHPDMPLLMRWMMTDNAIEKQNLRLSARVEDVVRLFEAHGFGCCLLKGQGNARMYPNVLSRLPGDIDLWVDGERKDVEHFCRELNPKTVIAYHHAQQGYKDVELEVHFHPNYAGNYLYNKRLQRYFEQHRAEQMAHKVRLEGCEADVAVPTDSFNRIFQLSHVMKHFLYEGVGLRQVIDYYYLLRRGMSETEKAEEERLMRHLNLYKFATALMYVLHTYLGLEERYLSVEPSEKEGRILLASILKSGNFGRADASIQVKGKGRGGTYLTFVRRSMQFARHYPAEVIFGRPFVPLWRRVLRLMHRG